MKAKKNSTLPFTDKMFINRIYNEDCFITMENMVKNNFLVDGVLTSPPYNTARVGAVHNSEKARLHHWGRYDVFEEFGSGEEYIEWTIKLFNKFDEILKKDGVIIYNLSYGSENTENTELMWRVVYNIFEHTPFTLADNIIWKKQNALPNNTSSNKLTRICEYIYIFCRKTEFHTFKSNKPKLSIGKNGQQYYKSTYNYIEAPNNDEKCDLNKATFSTELVKKLLDIYIYPESVVYDPFMGTGTTAKGCLQRNMCFVGSEVSEAQVEYSLERLEKEEKNNEYSLDYWS